MDLRSFISMEFNLCDESEWAMLTRKMSFEIATRFMKILTVDQKDIVGYLF